jgi:hypothetical protein
MNIVKNNYHCHIVLKSDNKGHLQTLYKSVFFNLKTDVPMVYNSGLYQ